MTIKRSTVIFGTAVLAAGLLAACGGGTGSVSAPAVVPQTSTPAATTTPPTAQLQGKVVDAESTGSPGIAGATVRIGTAFRLGMISGVIATATTAPDGSFTAPVPLTTSLPAAIPIPGSGTATAPPQTTNTLFVQVDATGFVPYHNVVFLWVGAVSAPSFAIAHLGPNDMAALATLNADRARLGTGDGTTPLLLDSNATLTARFATITEATQGFFSHTYPGTQTPVGGTFYCPLTYFCGRYYAASESEVLGGDIVSQELGYIAEGPSGGHYQAVISPTNVWVGFGQASGLPPVGGQGTANYAAQDYITATSTTP